MTGTPVEPDRVAGAPHPSASYTLAGQEPAERAFLESYRSGRLHHAWLLSGPRGIGKATLAWRIARFLLAGEERQATLDMTSDHPVARQVAAFSQPGLALLRRGWNADAGRWDTEIRVGEVRRLKSFFELSAAHGGRRVAVVDAAEEMTDQAANALLKLLEEPPQGGLLLLVSHRPGRLLPTIRSRCRELRLRPLTAEAVATALAAAGIEAGDDAAALGVLAGGSAGEAARLSQAGGLEIYRELAALFAEAPGIDRPRARALGESAGGRAEADRFDMVATAIELFLARLARAGAAGPPTAEAAAGEAAILARLAPDADAGRAYADLARTLAPRARRGRGVNLDPAALILDTLVRIDAQSGAVSGRRTRP